MTAPEGRTSTLGEVQAHNLTVIWVGCVIAGGVAISALWGVRQWRLAIPLLIMLGYFVYGITLRNRNTQQFADSMYFMGFLWTLWALFTGTVLRGEAGIALTPAELGTVFGYALITTAAGMFIRVALLQSQHLLTDQMLEGREDFERRLNALMAALEQATQSVQKSGTVLSDAVAKTATDMVVATDAAIGVLSDGTEGATRVFTERTRASLGALESAVGDLAPAMEPLSGALKEIASEMGAGSRALKRSLGELAAGLESGANRLEEIAPRLTQSFETASASVGHFVTSLESAPARLEELRLTTVKCCEGFSDLTVRLNQLATEVQTSPATFEGLRLTAAQCADGFSELRGHLDRLAHYASATEADAVAEDLRKLAEVRAAISEAGTAASLLQRCVLEVVDLVRRELRAHQ